MYELPGCGTGIKRYDVVVVGRGLAGASAAIYSARKGLGVDVVGGGNGDISTVPFKQIIISMGEGAKAALSAFEDRVRGVLG